MNNRLIKSNDAGGGGCTNTVDLYNPFPDGGGVALYQLNGDATDVSGNYDATTVTNITWGGAGEFGTSAAFNGSSSKIECPSIPIGTGDFSYSFWINCGNQTVGEQTYIFRQGEKTSERWFGCEINTTTQLLRFIVDDGISLVALETIDITDSAWHFISFVRKNSTIYAYIDNNSYSIAANSNSVYENSTLGIGYKNSTNQNYFNGSIDQLRFFNRALRPYEVEALYTEEYCTPTIVPSEHFNTITWTGDGASTRSFTGVGFQPDFVWTKRRSAPNENNLFDSVRGLPLELRSDTTGAELTSSYGSITSFDIDGFTTTAGANGNENQNTLNETVVAWNFKAGGAAVSNTDGTITSQVSANTEAGFSVVTFTSPNGASDTSYTVGHGLGVTPNVVIAKSRNATGGWYTYHSGATNNNQFIRLDTTGAVATAGSAVWGAGMTNDVFGVTLDQSIDQNDTNVAYCFAEVEGFSSFGSYVGTGASGNTVVTGFEPAFVMLKSTSATGNWRMWDNKRTLQNPRNNVLIANGSNAEFTNDVAIEFLENGFSFLGSGSNDSGASFIYMAFAADPTTVEPTLEDSFNTVTYTGAGSNQQVTGVGFQPDLVWIKNRDTTNTHTLHDTIRGIGNQIASNTTGVEQDETAYFTGVGDGFLQFGLVGGNYNTIGQDYVAWAWKGAELPAINSNGSIPSVVSANPAAGFSIVSYTGNGQDAQTVGHGLGNTPSIVITKNRNKNGNLDGNWAVAYIPGVTAGYLNLTAGFDTGRFDALFGSGINDNTFTVSTGGAIGYGHTNGANDAIIAYCFAEVAGFSKFGSYTGNGSTNGPTITTGFEPAFVMIKRTNTNANWVMKDIKRGDLASLYPNLSDAEYTVYDEVDFLSDGFQLKSNDISSNSNSSTYIYMAFANQF